MPGTLVTNWSSSISILFGIFVAVLPARCGSSEALSRPKCKVIVSVIAYSPSAFDTGSHGKYVEMWSCVLPESVTLRTGRIPRFLGCSTYRYVMDDIELPKG